MGKGTAYYTSYIFETDQNGNLLREWRTPDGIESANDAFLESDSTLVVAASLGRDLCFGPRPDDHCQLEWNGKVYKFNLKTREKIWETTLLGDQYGALWENSILDIIPSMEHDGYIVSGSDYYNTTPACSQIDTSDRCWNTPGIIAKVSNDGDSLWMRRYVGIVDIYTSNLLFDAEITPDSGYSFVGETFNIWPGPDQGQHGWLLMTDRYGCLVPGCHLTSSIEKDGYTPPQQGTFKIHPNPTSDFLNVFITRDLPKSSSLYLFSSIGIEVDHWANFESGTTYMISIDQYPPGLYYLTISDGTQVLGTEKVILK